MSWNRDIDWFFRAAFNERRRCWTLRESRQIRRGACRGIFRATPPKRWVGSARPDVGIGVQFRFVAQKIERATRHEQRVKIKGVVNFYRNGLHDTEFPLPAHFFFLKNWFKFASPFTAISLRVGSILRQIAAARAMTFTSVVNDSMTTSPL